MTAIAVPGQAADDVERRNPWRWFEAGVALLAALPTLAGAARGAGLSVDDWAFAAHSRYESFLHAYGTQTRSRPIEGLWNWAEFKLLGTHPVPHLLVLAAVNAAAAVLLFRLLDRWLPRRIAVLTTLVWVALPNRGSTHFWLTNSPHVFSVVLMLAAVLVVSREPFTVRRFATAVGLLVLATFAYEGALCLGALALVLIVWHEAAPAVRLRLCVIALAVLGAAGLWTLITSPKLNASPTPFRNASHLIAGHFGEGVMPAAPLVVGALALLVTAWSIATLVLPSFPSRIEERLVIVGLVALILGALPFLAGGFPFATDGLFDRGHLFADLGTAVFYGAALSMLWRLPSPSAATVLAGAAVIALAVPGVSDLNNFVRTQRDGRRFLAAIDELPAPLRTKGPITFLPLPNRGGVSEFVADYDISAALALRYHTGWPYPRAQMELVETGFKKVKGPTYELVGRHLVRR
ncbi:MAG: hypothetical protein JOZ68_09870 [Acidimicrobiia bacterium]|nr:hypothetical protein [Acidimicrobiia bacterium]